VAIEHFLVSGHSEHEIYQTKVTLCNAFTKKRKVHSEGRIFRKKWTEGYFCISMKGKVLCLICRESIAVSEEHNTARHCNWKHKETYKHCVGFKKGT
jgi:hypothetical protein